MKDIEDEVSLKMCGIILDIGKNSIMFLLNTKCWDFMLDIHYTIRYLGVIFIDFDIH